MKIVIFRVFSVLGIFSLLLFTLPALTVMAASDITVDPGNGGVGAEFEIAGTEFLPEQEVYIIFAKDEAGVNDDLDDQVTTWENIGNVEVGFITGNFCCNR